MNEEMIAYVFIIMMGTMLFVGFMEMMP